MARAKEFDVDQALDSAVELFREKGYEGASMCDLVETMGIGRQSLYDTFGDKKQLFVRAIERYTARGRASVAAVLFDEAAGGEALEQYFDGLIHFLTPREGRGGCLIAAAIVEVGTDDENVSSVCQDNQKKVVNGLERAIRGGMASGEFRNDLAVRDSALFLMTQVYGLTVMARNGAGRTTLKKVVGRALESLR